MRALHFSLLMLHFIVHNVLKQTTEAHVNQMCTFVLLSKVFVIFRPVELSCSRKYARARLRSLIISCRFLVDSRRATASSQAGDSSRATRDALRSFRHRGINFAGARRRPFSFAGEFNILPSRITPVAS